MALDFTLLAIGIAIAGYCIGDGLKNFKNPNVKNIIEYLDEGDEHELLKESEVHHFIGISKEDARALVEEHAKVPHININGNVYYPKSKLREWLMNIGSKQE